MRFIFVDAFRTNSRNIIGGNPSMVIPLLAIQDLTPMLGKVPLYMKLVMIAFVGGCCMKFHSPA